MTRQEIYREIEQTFGLIPSMFKAVPDNTLELEWELFKRVSLEEGPISNKNRELMGLVIAGVTKCRYCTFYHTELAKLHGATEEEIEASLHYAKLSAGWSAYINGLQIDFDTFKAEILKACDHVRSLQPETV